VLSAFGQKEGPFLRGLSSAAPSRRDSRHSSDLGYHHPFSEFAVAQLPKLRGAQSRSIVIWAGSGFPTLKKLEIDPVSEPIYETKKLSSAEEKQFSFGPLVRRFFSSGSPPAFLQSSSDFFSENPLQIGGLFTLLKRASDLHRNSRVFPLGRKTQFS